MSSDLEFCVDNEVRFFGSGCMIAFVGHGDSATTCISSARLSELAHEMFNDSYI